LGHNLNYSEQDMPVQRYWIKEAGIGLIPWSSLTGCSKGIFEFACGYEVNAL
jgi:hypothetical protein